MCIRSFSLLLTTSVLLSSHAFGSTTYTVNTNGDNSVTTGATSGSLGWCISQANLVPDSVIDLGSSSAPFAVTLSESLPPITATLTIKGFGAAVNGQDQYAAFLVQSGSLTLKELTVENALALGGDGTPGPDTFQSGGSGGGGNAYGGGLFIRSGAVVTLNGSSLSGNTSQGGAGGLASLNNTTCSQGAGGVGRSEEH